MTAHAEACSAQDSFQSAADKMSSLGVGALPVVQNGQVVGMVVRGLSHNEAAGTIQGVMSYHVVTVSPVASVEEAAALMSQNQGRRLPVVENGNLVGMLALGDLAVQQQSDQKAGAALSEISEKDHLH
ncbi:CBS domain-containing protein [Rossellomorea vietnamensis]|uniref:CBS domain-containing protein n=2 Tax=Rossellomorea vietnamensis TaxID=218284 RepID=A0A5D4NKW8_9BACI|nr:CBS domain-containing protein [Rossellomorea vietnamensis]